MSWTNYSVQINVRVSIHDEADVSPEQLINEASRRLTDVVGAEVDRMRDTKPDRVEIELA